MALFASLVTVGASAAPITLKFDGIATPAPFLTVRIGDYYNGGTASNGRSGPDLDIQFGVDARVLCLSTAARPACSGASKGGLGLPGSEDLALRFAENFINPSPIVNVFAGFDVGFSFAYGRGIDNGPTQGPLGIQIWDGLNGTGNLLAEVMDLPVTPSGSGASLCPPLITNCPFSDFGIPFAGTAMSVVFTGRPTLAVFDDLTFGSLTVGGGAGAVAEPGSAVLAALALSAFAAIRHGRALRRRP